MDDGLVLAVDQGTSATKCVLIDAAGSVVSEASAPVGIVYPRPGWVEQSADAIADSVLAAAADCLQGRDPRALAAVGLSTQRESVVLWDTDTGRAVGPVIGWQDRRTAPLCDRLRAAGHGAFVRERSGLPLDPMFSAGKIRWLLDTYDPDRTGRLRVATVDSWLVHRLVGADTVEMGNAARTQLLDVRRGEWDRDLTDLFGIPASVLPQVVPSTGKPRVVRETGGVLDGAPLRAVLADSHAALYAHGPHAATGVKVTYGTGSSAMRLVGKTAVGEGLCLTIGWADPEPVLAVEGNIRSTGSTIAWLTELLGLDAGALSELAATADSGGVCIVPAFGGLAAPWWNDAATGVITGLTLGTGPAQLARAALESVALQVNDVVTAIGGVGDRCVLADGGASADDTLMQIQADICGLPVYRCQRRHLSAVGAAGLAGREAGLWSHPNLPRRWGYDEFKPATDRSAAVVEAWRGAVARSLPPSNPSDVDR